MLLRVHELAHTLAAVEQVLGQTVEASAQGDEAARANRLLAAETGGNGLIFLARIFARIFARIVK